MKRLASLLVISAVIWALLVPVALANTSLSATLVLDKPAVLVGDHVVLSINLSGVTDVYSATVSMYYDPTKLMPVLPPATDTVTTAEGLVTLGASVDASGDTMAHTAMTTEALTSVERLTLVSTRLGNQPGAGTPSGTTGNLVRVQFKTLTTGAHTFFLDQSSQVSGAVRVNLVASTGQPAYPSAAVSQVSLSAAPVPPLAIASPVHGGYAGTKDIVVSGTAPGAGLTGAVSIGSASVTVSTNAVGQWSVPFTNLSDGTRQATATFGPSSVSATFTVDTTPPAVTISPVGNVMTPLPLTGTFTDANIHKVFVQANPEGPPQPEDAAEVSGGTWAKAINLRGGTNQLKVTALDKVGLQSTAWAGVVYTSTSLRLETDRNRYEPGDEVMVTAYMENVPQNLEAMTVEMVFDGTMLEFLGADENFQGTVLGGDGVQAFVDTAGITTSSDVGIRVNITNPHGIQAGTNKAFVIFLRARDQAPDNYVALSIAEVTYGATSEGDGVLLHNVDGAILPDAGGTGKEFLVQLGGRIAGTVPLLGRSDGNHAGATVTLTLDDGSTLTATTDASGTFLLEAVPPGTYGLTLTKTPYLVTEVMDVPVIASKTQWTLITHLNVGLIPGNITDTNDSKDSIFLEDLSALAKAWGTSDGINVAAFTAVWNPRADLNGTGNIDLGDLMLLGQYWGKAGATNAYASPETVIQYAAPAPQ